MIVIASLTVVGWLGWSWSDLTFVLAFILHKEWRIEINCITHYLVQTRHTRVIIRYLCIILGALFPPLIVFGVSLSVLSLSLLLLLIIFSATKQSINFRLSKVITYEL